MRSGADHLIILPFEIERSYSICEQRRDSCTCLRFYFFQIPSQFFVIDAQSWAIFKTGKNRIFLGGNSFDKKHKQKTKKRASHRGALEHLL